MFWVGEDKHLQHHQGVILVSPTVLVGFVVIKRLESILFIEVVDGVRNEPL